MFQGVLGLYYDLFYYLETMNMLVPNNDVHLFCLHHVFIPRINRHLDPWKEAWVKHPMRTEHNMTPEQLWTSGLLSISGSGNQIAQEVFESLNEVSIRVGMIVMKYSYHIAMSEMSYFLTFLMQDETQDFGIDWDGPSPLVTDESVEVPHTECPITAEEVNELQHVVPPLSQSTEYGIDLHERTLDFVLQRLI